MHEKTDELRTKTWSHLNGYIKSADQKASILLTAQFAFLGLYANVVTGLWSTSAQTFKLWVIASTALTFSAIACAVIVVFPRSADGDLMYWENISSGGFVRYVTKLRSLNGDSAEAELLQANYNLSVVAAQKYRWIRIGLVLSVAAIVTSTVSIGFYLASGG